MCCFIGSERVAVHEIGPDDKPIIAWRKLRIRRVGWRPQDGFHGFQLTSPYQFMPWDGPRQRLSRPIGLTTFTGFYCRPTRGHAVFELSRHGVDVLIKVEMRGRVIEYKNRRSGAWTNYGNGYRAQEVRIVEMEFPRGSGDAAKWFRRQPQWKEVKITTRRTKR